MEDELVKVADGIWLHTESSELMRKLVRETLKLRGQKGEPGMTVAEIRDLLGTSRKFAVPICEHLDAIGLTRREGDTRVLAVALHNETAKED
jgi:selenocysteine-specific elongation factor